MKKILTLTLLIFALSLFTACEDKQYDFKNITWGMSIDEVVKAERGALITRTQEMLSYPENLGGKAGYVILLYYFNETGCYKAVYVKEGVDAPILATEYGEKLEKEIGKSKSWEFKNKILIEVWETERTIITTKSGNTSSGLTCTVTFEAKR